MGERFPRVAGSQQAYDDEYEQRVRGQVQALGSSYQQNTGRSPKPPSKQQPSMSSSVSPKRQQQTQQNLYYGDGGNSNNSNGNGPGNAYGQDRVTDSHLLYDMPSQLVNDVIPYGYGQQDEGYSTNFLPNQSNKKGAGLPGLSGNTKGNSSNSNSNSRSIAAGGAGVNPHGLANLKNAKNGARTNTGAKGKEVEQQQQDSEYLQSYIDELETHIESGSTHLAAWKIRYYVELHRLNLSRRSNTALQQQLEEVCRCRCRCDVCCVLCAISCSLTLSPRNPGQKRLFQLGERA